MVPSLLAWYKTNDRQDLPWRQNRDPYRIWISEAMLQQTQVATVIPYYRRFLSRFPTVQALAQAPMDEVLDHWSGLGYYSRVKNLHAAAQLLVRNYNGRLPKQVSELQKLPGIGRYTAGAISSIAFDRPEPVVDGNVIRVLSRLYGIRQDPAKPAVLRKLWELAARLVPLDSPGDFNQALMDLGSTLCTPRQPQCGRCPVKTRCIARKKGLQEIIPPVRPAVERKKIRYLCAVIRKGDLVLMARRALEGLLPGLWEFPGGEFAGQGSAKEGLSHLLKERLGVTAQPIRLHAQLKQTLTHRDLRIQAYVCGKPTGRLRVRWYSDARWVPIKQLPRLALTAGMAKLVKTL